MTSQRSIAVSFSLVLIAALAALPALARDETSVALAERGQWKQLRARVTPRLQTNPEDAETLWLMSRVKQAFGDPATAMTYAEKAVKLEPGNAEYHFQLAEMIGSAAQKAGPLKGLGLAKRFRKEAEAAVALDPKHIEARTDLILFYLKAPGIVGGDKAKAAALVEEIGRIDPARGLLARARMGFEQKDTVRAEQSLRKAAEMAPANYEIQMAASNFYANRDQWDLAEKHAKAAMAVDAKRSGPYSLLAMVAAERGQWAEVDAKLAAAETATPDNLSPFYHVGRVLVTEKKEPARAERYLRKYLGAEPEGFSPSLAGAHWRLGQALEQQGKMDLGIAEVESAVAMKPDLDDAKKDLKRMKRGRPVANAR